MLSKVFPESDLWAAGVMTFQLLSGSFPFDDVKNPSAPALSLIWRSILGEEPSFLSASWKDISQAAKDFVKSLLQKYGPGLHPAGVN
jgi:calcium-dependent protein kinase